MGDTVIVETPVDEVVSIVTAGPQGPSGSEAATLTTTGDLLYRDALANDRLPIGSEGQVLKVASGLPAWGNESGSVTSVAGRTGDVTLAVADVANAVSDSDARLTDARTPTSHAASHATGGSDAIAPSDIGAANTSHTHAASDITSGTLTHERGGLEADVSAYDGLLKISGGSTSAVTVTSAGEALLDDADAAAQRTTLGLGTVASSNSYTDLDNQPSIPSALNDLSNVSAAAPSDNDVLTYDNATSTWVAEAPAAGGGFGEVRFDTSGSYTYTGQAAEGSSESSAVWFIRRSEFSSAGAYVSTTTANNVKWDDRLTASYT